MTLPNRCLTAVVAGLLLHGLCLTALGLVLGAHADALLLLRLAGVLLFGAAVTTFVLRPLRADLALVEAIANNGDSAARESAFDSPQTAESGALFDGLMLVRARSRELESVEQGARRSLEEAERLRASFVAAMAHDLRGPLNSVIGFSDLLVMEGQDAVAASQRPSVELIRRSGQDLLVLIEQILDWAKLEAGQLTLTKSTVELEQVIASATHEAVARSADRGLRIERQLAADLPTVQADPERLAQALLGLMDHATRAADRPRVSITARVVEASEGRPRRVQLELRDPQLHVREADQGSFFEAFRPSYAPSGRRLAGLGLGPALGRALIRAHGGEVWFASRGDTGTTFTVELPTGLG
jgi:signal transduction histidine kinase